MELKPCLIGEIMQLPVGGPGPDPTCHSGWRRPQPEETIVPEKYAQLTKRAKKKQK